MDSSTPNAALPGLDHRSAGILLHPTSLPGPYGVGDLGESALRWIEFVAASGCQYWQVLPLGPTGYGDSPYQCFSSFAGNPFLVSPQRLLEDGLLSDGDLADRPRFDPTEVDFGRLIPWKLRVLDLAFDRFRRSPGAEMADGFRRFRAEHRAWLDDFSLFMAIKDEGGGGAWTGWPDSLRQRDRDAIAAARRRLADSVDRHAFRQFLFFEQWARVRDHAREHAVDIIGDIPIFVSPDSADVWGRPDLFQVDGRGMPVAVAGVPPDYFSPTGQLWGNPLYDWSAHVDEGFAWWIDRIRAVLSLVDVVRVDHFRAFADYWRIPAGAKTAEIGEWIEGPGDAFFEAVSAGLGGLPIIAEDLGELSPAVPELRDRWGLPGMKILQFAFEEGNEDFLPDRYPEASVVYPGTHDNDTTRGWWRSASGAVRLAARRRLQIDTPDKEREIAWVLIEASWASRARLAVATLQDFLNLGTAARMNMPGEPAGNWTWRMDPAALSPDIAARIKDLNHRHGRLA